MESRRSPSHSASNPGQPRSCARHTFHSRIPLPASRSEGNRSFDTLPAVEPEEARLAEVLALFHPEVRRYMLDILTADDETRAKKIGELHQAGGAVAELLMDLEEDPVVRVTVIGMLRVLG